MDTRSVVARTVIAYAGAFVFLMAWLVAVTVGRNNIWAVMGLMVLSLIGSMTAVILWAYFWTKDIPKKPDGPVP